MRTNRADIQRMPRTNAGATGGGTGGGSGYALPLAADGTRGGVQIGYTTSAANKKYAVQLDSEKMYVEVGSYPWAGLSDKPETATRWPAWSDITSKPATATRWPSWSEVSSKPASKTAWGQTYLDSSSNFSSISGNLSSVGHISFSGDNTYDLGASGTRARSGYFGTSLNVADIEIGRTNEINATSGVLYIQYRSPGTNLVLCHNGGNVGIGNSSPSYKLDVSGVIYSNTGVYSAGYVTALSDARHKTIVRNTNISVEQIAAMRSVVYRWNDRRDDSLHVGSIAQDWQEVLPQVVSVADDKEHTLGLQYGVAALVAAITIARKVVDHEERIKALERENADLKQAYSFIKNAYEELKLKIA